MVSDSGDVSFLGQILNVETTLKTFLQGSRHSSVLAMAYETLHDLVPTCLSGLISSIPHLALSAPGLFFSIKPWTIAK